MTNHFRLRVLPIVQAMLRLEDFQFLALRRNKTVSGQYETPNVPSLGAHFQRLLLIAVKVAVLLVQAMLQVHPLLKSQSWEEPDMTVRGQQAKIQLTGVRWRQF